MEKNSRGAKRMILPFRLKTEAFSVEIKTNKFLGYIEKSIFQKSFGIFIREGECGGLETCRTTFSIYLSDLYLTFLKVKYNVVNHNAFISITLIHYTDCANVISLSNDRVVRYICT